MKNKEILEPCVSQLYEYFFFIYKKKSKILLHTIISRNLKMYFFFHQKEN